jgi:hypothetical protein
LESPSKSSSRIQFVQLFDCLWRYTDEQIKGRTVASSTKRLLCLDEHDHKRTELWVTRQGTRKKRIKLLQESSF